MPSRRRARFLRAGRAVPPRSAAAVAGRQADFLGTTPVVPDLIETTTKGYGMTKLEIHGAEGEIRLRRNWRESSTGACEAFDDLDLASSEDGTSVILFKSQGERDPTAKDGANVRESRIQITVPELVSLIEQHGREI